MARHDGARPGILKAMGITAAPAPMAQSVKCGICNSMLDFDTDPIGRLVEFCPNGKCYNHQPHQPQADAPLLPKSETRTRKTRTRRSHGLEEGDTDA